MTDTAFDTDRDVRPAALIVTLPPLDDGFPDDVHQAAAAYETACEQWSAADASIEEIAGRIANADHEDARRIAAAARAGDNLDDVELVDRRQLTEDHHRAVLTARALAGRLHEARLHLLGRLGACRADTLTRTAAACEAAAADYQEALRLLRRARMAWHHAVATHAWHQDISYEHWPSFTGRVPAARVTAHDPQLAPVDQEAGRLISAHVDHPAPQPPPRAARAHKPTRKDTFDA